MAIRKITLIINNYHKTIVCDTEDSLADTLRRNGYTSVKMGCGTGQCGSCNIIVNGKLTKSCTLKMKKLEDYSTIETLEGLGSVENLHPLQLAWIKYNALQCGFCSPGYIVSAKALLKENPAPSRHEVRQWFQKHLNACRCTGYKPIVDAVMAAAAVMRGEAPVQSLLFEHDGLSSLYGSEYPRPNAVLRVTGQCDYGDDINMKLPAAALHLAPVFAGVSHGRILSVDSSEAERMPGVVKVITSKDVKGTNRLNMPIGRPQSKALGNEQPILAEDTVKRWGDVVALVAAESRETAREAAARVRVSVEPLPEYMNLLEAIAPDAMQIHPNVPNHFYTQPHIVGDDPAKAFEDAAATVEASYYTQRQPHLAIEPEAALAYVDAEGNLSLHYKFQTLYNVKGWIADSIGLPPEKIRIIANPAGGSFGYTLTPLTPAMVAVAALATGRPCALTMSFSESQHSIGKRAPAFSNVRLAADKNGKLSAMEYELAFDCGAYPQIIGVLADKGPCFVGLPYNIPSVRGQTGVVFTNHNFNVTYRSYGVVSTSTINELAIDELAYKAGIDPLEFRYNNVLRPGEYCTEGHLLDSYSMPELIDRMRPYYKDAQLWCRENSTDEIKYGVGVCSSVYKAGGSVADRSEVALELNPDGSITNYSTWADLGQGADVGTLIHTHEALRPLGIRPEQIKIVMGDTATCPNSGMTAGSRSHYMNGQAILDAADKLMNAMRKSDGSYRSYAEMVEEGIATKYIGSFSTSVIPGMRNTDPETGDGFTAATNAYSFMLAVAGVNVNTGKIKVEKFISFSDVGKVGSKHAVEGQAFSGICHGIGLALSEDYEDIKKHGSLYASGFPYIESIPDDMQVYFVDSPRETGPHGSSGCSESFQSSPHTAVNNAVFNACGIRLREFPMTPEKVRAALKAKAEGKEDKCSFYDLGLTVFNKTQN